MEAKKIIEELIELSNTKYGYLKIGQDTLNEDILFIEKFQKLKELLGTETFDNIDMTQYPRIRILQGLIKDISILEKQKQNRNVRVSKAVNAYKKK